MAPGRDATAFESTSSCRNWLTMRCCWQRFAESALRAQFHKGAAAERQLVRWPLQIAFVRTHLLLGIFGVAFVACAPTRAAPHVTPEPALAVEVSRFGQSGIGYACLPRTGDSTRFEVLLVVDSLQALNGDDVTLVRNVRAAPRPGYTNQAVTVEIQRAGQTRIVGTSCWHDAGIVVRGSNAVLNHATIMVRAPASVLMRILDGRGRPVSDSVWSTLQGSTQRVEWVRR